MRWFDDDYHPPRAKWHAPKIGLGEKAYYTLASVGLIVGGLAGIVAPVALGNWMAVGPCACVGAVAIFCGIVALGAGMRG